VIQILKSLKFQIALALLLLLGLFSFASIHTRSVLERQREDDTLLRLAGQLQLSFQHMTMQAMNYKENAPRDYATYHRDLNLYYQDLMSSSTRFGGITRAFAQGHFPMSLTGMGTLLARLEPATREAAVALDAYWQAYERGLQERLGNNAEEPRLEQAAEHIIAHSGELEQKTKALLQAMEVSVQNRTQTADAINRLVILGALLVSAGILAWFYLQVLRPLTVAVKGFRQVANGDFGYRVPLRAENEIGVLARSFNQLSGRLHTLFQLLTRLQQGSDLDQTLKFVADSFPPLLPLDWVGALFVHGDGQIQLERAYGDGRAEILGILRFHLQDTLLEQCLTSGKPLHIPDVREVADASSNYRFLSFLAERGRRDAIFLPLQDPSPLPGILVFATRQAHAYNTEHLTLLANLATLTTLSFGRTLKLAEHARLAAIGQFASSIAHEIRSPLATISLALDYLKDADLPEGAAKRTALAAGETQRLGRLLDDMLLYAKPLHLAIGQVALEELLQEFLETHGDLAKAKGLILTPEIEPGLPPLSADRDRLIQVLLNLLRNAVDAAPIGTRIRIFAGRAEAPQLLQVGIHNEGEAIPSRQLERLGEPFFTAKPGGTGLGLAIVRRIVEAHGGTLEVRSDRDSGTRVTLQLPI